MPIRIIRLFVRGIFCILGMISISSNAQAEAATDEVLRFASGTLTGWTVTGTAWEISESTMFYRYPGDLENPVADSREHGEAKTGTLRSPNFTITEPIQSFRIAGWDGLATGTNDASSNYVRMRLASNDALLFSAHTPGQNKLVRIYWDTSALIGQQVYLEVLDQNPSLNPGGYAWIAFADYRQGSTAEITQPVQRNDLYALKIDNKAGQLYCRSLRFLAADSSNRGSTIRQTSGDQERIQIGASAQQLYLLGLINAGWDQGVAHWSYHPELDQPRTDQIAVGSTIGWIRLNYADGSNDTLPLTIGATAWYGEHWLQGREPFVTRADCRSALEAALHLHRETLDLGYPYSLFYLAITPRAKTIASLDLLDNTALRGKPLVSGITLASPSATTNMLHLGTASYDAADLATDYDVNHPPSWSSQLEKLKSALYTSDRDLPTTATLVSMGNLDAMTIDFIGPDPWGTMLTNIWRANLLQMEDKFDRVSGLFDESSLTTPNYGSYQGYGGWFDIGGYAGQTFSRSADHLATVVMRGVYDTRRWRAFIDYVDYYLYFYRANHDTNKGPANTELDIARYPADAPPHWSFGTNAPLGPNTAFNEIPGAEEMEGHASVMIGRWLAWRLLGQPTESWINTGRSAVFGKSRWQSTIDSAEFICWLMDYTGRDVIWSEGEATGWGGPNLCLLPTRMSQGGTTEKIKQNYRQAQMFETYATYLSYTALRCSAEIAEKNGDTARAQRWRTYATRIISAMRSELTVSTTNGKIWRECPYSIFPITACSLVQAWGSMYLDGYDPTRWDNELTSITRNSFRRYMAQPAGTHAVLGMGYGQGWLAQSALMLDEMDHAGELLGNIARYTYDKNLDYVDATRSIDWRPWLWLIPEGTNVLPDGHWNRIGDLSNGANQGIAMHALETCAGLDDCDPTHIMIMPRVPDPLTGLHVQNSIMLVPLNGKLTTTRVSYQYARNRTFRLQATVALPRLTLRLGPFASDSEVRQILEQGRFPSGSTLTSEASGTYQNHKAWWLKIDGLQNVTNLSVSLQPTSNAKTGRYYQ